VPQLQRRLSGAHVTFGRVRDAEDPRQARGLLAGRLAAVEDVNIRAATGQLEARGQPDGPGADDEHVTAAHHMPMVPDATRAEVVNLQTAC
jgi:hypothetical protein